MVDLKKLYESLGFSQAETYLQSGNVVFEATTQEISTLETSIERLIVKTFGFSVTVINRKPGDFERIIAANPFLVGPDQDTGRLYVTFLKDIPSGEKLAHLAVPTGETDELKVGEKEVYLFCPNGYGRTKINNTFFEKKLGVAATTRNWNTVLALYQMTQNQ